jgi:hypothetical protein
MKRAGRRVDPLPDEFASEAEAAEFWDTHSLTDYDEFLEPADLQVQVQRRHFEIEVDEQSFLALRSVADKQHRPIKQLASEILRRELATS